MKEESEIQELRQLRLKLGMSQDEIAKKLYCNRVTLANWERSKKEPQPIFKREIKKLLNSLKRDKPT